VLARVRLLLALAVLLAPARGRAQGTDTDRQIAETLFEQGRALMDAKNYAEACPKLAESQRLDPGGGTLLNLAVCHELEGKTATAQSEFKEALGQAARDGRADREELAREHLAALEPRIVRVVVIVPKQDVAITFDASKLAPAAWGIAIAVDPGEHRVVAEAPGGTRWESIVDAREEGRTYRIEVPPLERARPITLPHANVERVRPKAFWWLVGGGSLVFASGIATGIVALEADRYIDDNCIAARDFCRVDDAGAAADRATTFAWISTAALTLGAAAIITAFFLPRETRVVPATAAKF
jgi:tetratricopeptide (TPR) repeat protein